jgi:hypothetical protein
MKKFIFIAALASLVSVGAFAQASAPVAAASSPAKPAVADATVICANGEAKKASAVGQTVRVTASCGDTKVVTGKPKAVAHKRDDSMAQAAGNTAAVKLLAEENTRLKQQVASQCCQVSTAVPAAMTQTTQSVNINRHKEIKLGEVACIVSLHGGQYTNGQPIAMTFRPTQAECDEWELGVRSRYVKGSVNDAIITSDSATTTLQKVAVFEEKTQVGNGNVCVRKNKAGERQIYGCGDRIAVIRANGEVACRPQTAPIEPGESLCTGVQ